MFRITALSVVTTLGLLWTAVPADAQVSIRAPFVQVETGQGVYVRAPFVRLWIPSGPPPAYLMPPRPGIQVMPPAGEPPLFVPNNPPPPTPIQPNLPQPQQLATGINDGSPQPLQVRHPTLTEFARSFQARAGQYDVTIINPVTQQPAQVRFALPEGTPRRVIVDQDEIEFRYSLRQFVRIQFTSNGAVVTAR